MHYLQLDWRSALTVALALTVLHVPLRLVRRRHAAFSFFAGATAQTAIVLALFALWQIVGGLSQHKIEGAYSRGRWLFHLEQAWHLPSEVDLQHLVLPHPDLVRSMNLYYLYAHFNGMLVFLVWLFVRHRDRFAHWRNTIVLVTGWSLLIQLIPVAPPRLLPDLGFIDTALLYGQSVYGPHIGSGIADQLSTMPSVHVAWALLIGAAVVQVSPSRWRWLALLHTVATIVVVSATANHYWLDGIVAGALLVAALLLQWAGRAAFARVHHRLPARLRARPPVLEPQPA